MPRDSPHEERRDAVSYLADALFELSCEYEAVRKRPEPFEFWKRKPTVLGPMHSTMHTEVAIIAADRARRFPRIEFHGIESLACDVTFRGSHAHLVPVLERAILPCRLEQRRQLLRRRGAAGERFLCCNGGNLRSRVAGNQQRSSQIPMKIIRSRIEIRLLVCGPPMRSYWIAGRLR